MKQSKILVIAVIAVDLILAVVCMIAYFGEDRNCPEFRFQTDEYIYTYEGGESKLLENITAYDDRDGDISERIVIEKITENRESSTIVVYYAVSDSAGNVAKISRVFVADFREQESSAGESAEALSGIPEDTALTMEKASETEDVSSEQPEAAETAGGADEQADGGAGENTVETADDPEGDETEGEETGENAGQAEDQPAAPASEPPREDRSGYPVLTLRTQEVTIAAGTSPPWTEIIETLRDDKDDYATLYYNLSVSRFNRNQAGDYPVSLYTEDSDGNRSDTVTVLVHVKGE